MTLSLVKEQAIGEITNILYEFLPNKPYPYADQRISIMAIASDMNLDNYYGYGSKTNCIYSLLKNTLEYDEGKFCTLILEFVRRGIIYRRGKNKSPITREEIESLNKQIEKIGFKIRDLWDTKFLSSLPAINKNKTEEKKKPEVLNERPDLEELRKQFYDICTLKPQMRGFEFEKFLNKLFKDFKLNPNPSFRNVGEQIDGSFELDGQIYLVEAKWKDKPIGNEDIWAFQGKITSKAKWTRGLFISYGGFSEDGIQAFERGHQLEAIGMNGQDLMCVLEGRISLVELLRSKIRKASEKGFFYSSAYEIALTK